MIFLLARISIRVKTFQLINANYMNKKNLQTRFSRHIFLNIYAYISDMHVFLSINKHVLHAKQC